MIKGVIFDLDGTLIDSMGIWYNVDRKFLLEHGVTDPPADISDKVKKMTIEESSAYFINEFGMDCTVDDVKQRIEELVRVEYEENIPLKAGVTELLDVLDSKGIPYGVATATYKKLAEAALKRCGIYDRFAFVLTDREYPKGKKFPDIFLGGAERLGTSPAETLVAEDSLHCIETAKNAGFVTAGFYDAASDADWDSIKNKADCCFDRIDKAETLFK
ncbi:MAG: HAD family phosphatase [Ruminococcus sp.]|nr:HAD family phosphatase [Ruminococcus sp.]